MRFYNFDLPFWENMHNSAVALAVVGVILLLFVLICHLTARTEEHKQDVKTMFYYGVPTGVIALIVALFLFPAAKTDMNIPTSDTANDKREIIIDTQYQSPTTKEDCRLCGHNPNDLLQFYFGENNIAILDLNTFDFMRLEVNRYDDDHNIIEQSSGTQIDSMRSLNGGSLHFSIHSARGYADGTIKNTKILSLDKLSTHLCSDCLTTVTGEYIYAGEQQSAAVINFATKEIIPLQEAVTGFTNGDYYIKSRYDDTDSSIELFVLYCPIRY